jgi:phosphoglycolate phosphatase-like HAD superfamily hydrolase
MSEGLTPSDKKFVAPRTGFKEQSFINDEKSEVYEQNLEQFKRLIESAKDLVLATDFDGTVSGFDPNPKTAGIDRKAQEALLKIHALGVPVVIMTGRAGAEVARLAQIPGAVIIGTAGWEVYKADENDPTKGESRVDERLIPYHQEITTILKTVRTKFFERVGGADTVDHSMEMTTEVPTSLGTVIFEKKALTSEFPEGITQEYNLNGVDSKKWDELVAALESDFNEHVSPGIKELFKLKASIDRAHQPPTCRVSISPLGEEGKHKSLIQLLRKDDEINQHTGRPRRKEYFKGVPGGFDGVIYIGDSNADAKALRATHLTREIAGRQSAGVVTFRPEDVGKNVQDRAVRNADVSVTRVEGTAQFLTDIANLIEQYYRK